MIPTLLFLARPRHYLDPVPEFDPGTFADRWTYKRDPLWGLWDVARDPTTVLEVGGGDCVDYARLAASWLYHHTERPIGLYVMGRVHNPPGHLVVYDGERVYSTGRIREESLHAYSVRTGRAIVVRRGIRDSAALPRGYWRPSERPTDRRR